MQNFFEPEVISRAISISREEGTSLPDGIGLPEMVRFLNDQTLAVGYSELN